MALAVLDFQNLETHFFRPVPAVKKMSGNIQLIDNRFDINVSKGVIDDVILDGSNITIRLDDIKDDAIKVNLIAQGPIKSMRKILENDAFKTQESIIGIPDKISGDTKLQAHFSFPLSTIPDTRAIKFTASAIMNKTVIPNLLLGNDFKNGKLKINMDQDRIKIKGMGELGGNPVSFIQENHFSDDKKIISTKELFLDINSEELEKFNISIPVNLNGVVSVKAKIKDLSNGLSEINAVVDLIDAQLSIPQLNWNKPKGAAGRVRLDY